jgi:lysophospholipid acyltransferase (LPLAT)-like uncharacterized protein
MAYLYSYLVGKTGKFEVHGVDEMETIYAQNNGGIFVGWHGRVLMLPYFWHGRQPVKALVSPHADGRIIACTLASYNIGSIEGSTDQKAARAAVDIVKELNRGTIVALISDGPRGPRMRLNKSVIYFAKKSGKPIIGLTYSSERAKVFRKAWDALMLPKLFKKGVVFTTKPMFVPSNANDDEVEKLRLQFETELNELTFKADKICGLDKVEPEDSVREKRHHHRHRR